MMIWLLILILGFLLFPKPAHAYLDPGSGSMMMQLLLAGFAGVAIALKMFWRRITSFFSGKKDHQSDSAKS